MRKHIKIPFILGMAVMVFGLISCTEKQEVAAPISPDGYPVATFTVDKTEIDEGDTLNVTITLDKMLLEPVDFEVRTVGPEHYEGDFEEAHGEVIGEGQIPPYSLSTVVSIIVSDDGVPEQQETVNIEVGAYDVGSRYSLNPSQEKGTFAITINSYNDPNALTMAYGWNTVHDDIDLFGIYKDDNNYFGGGAGALVDWLLAGTSANPEVFSLSNDPADSPDGLYYIGIDPYYVEGTSFNYYIHVGHPDQTVEIFTGTFNMNELDLYTKDFFAYWGVDSYRMLEVTFDGVDSFTVEHVHP